MRRSLFVLAIGAFLGSVVTLAVGLWVHGAVQHAVAQGEPSGAPISGDVNGDGKLDISDAIYIINNQFRGGPEPVPIVCPPTGLPATGQTKCYDVSIPANEIPCDSAEYPGQDGAYQAGCPSEGRFVDNGDGTVTDTCTGLMWQKRTADFNGDGVITADIPNGDLTSWQEALQYCEGLVFAGHTDWRLPNMRELQSIVDYGRSNPPIDPVFTETSLNFWSSSSYNLQPDFAWAQRFGEGVTTVEQKWAAECFVRAVRGGL